MGVISFNILYKAQERSWKAFVKNKNSEENFEYVMRLNSIKIKSSFDAHFANLHVKMKYMCMFCISY